MFASGSAPSGSLDSSFFASLGISGYVPAASGGQVSGTVSGIPSGFTGVVALANSATQYWTRASGTSYTISGVKPGTYTATLYKNKLAVDTGSVSVSANKTSSLSIAPPRALPTPSGELAMPKV